MKKNKVAVAQFSTEASIKKNLEKIDDMMSQARDNQAEMIFFPEEFLTHKISPDDKKGYAQPVEKNSLIHDLSTLAKKHKLALLAGSLPTRENKADDHKYFNTCVLFNHEGQVISIYNKIHLFDVKTTDNPTKPEYHESKLIYAGTNVVVTDTVIGKLGLSICYDVRFPEIYRQQVKQGAQIIAVPSAFTVETGKVHWEVLLRARAIENLCYVLAPAQMGDRYDGRKTYGHAMIISPWGEILQQSQEEGLLYAELDLTAQHNLRNRFPALNHIKLM